MSGSRFVRAGVAADTARAGAVLLHGRGGSAHDMLSLAEAIGGDGVAWIAPEAAGNSWYPFPFLAPLERNEPALSRALSTVEEALVTLARDGLARERVVLIGFSQGGCLALEFAARNAGRYGGVAGLSAGLIGPQGAPRDYAASMRGTPVFVGCSDVDPHIPDWRVRESAEVFRSLGAEVTERLYPGMGHTINDDEIAAVRAMLAGIRTGDRVHERLGRAG